MIDVQFENNSWTTEFHIDCAGPVSIISQSKLHKLKTYDRYLEVRSVPTYLMNAFCSATDNTIKITGRIFLNIHFEGCLAKNVELFITEGGQRDIIGNNALPQLSFEVLQKTLSVSINEIEM